MHRETAVWLSDCMHANVLVTQVTVGSCMGVGQEDPECVNCDTNGVPGVTCMVMWDCAACHVMRACMA